MSSKLRTMKRKMDRESAIPARRVEVMEELWVAICAIAKEQRGNPTMIINRILAEAIGAYQRQKKAMEDEKTRLVKPVGGMGDVARKIQDIKEGKVTL